MPAIGNDKMPLNGNTLKLIAVITMFIDHVGAVLVARFILLPEYDSAFWTQANTYIRSIGRIAFPIFCFLLVEGFCHTKNVRKYAGRMLLFALISEIPFNLAITGRFWNHDAQNVYWQLLLGLMAMMMLKKTEESRYPYAVQCIFRFLIVISFMLAAEIACVDYGANGVLSICLLYIFRHYRILQLAAGALSFWWELPAPLAFLFPALYNGKRGRKIKNAFYIFYPAHLLVLYVAARVIGCPY